MLCAEPRKNFIRKTKYSKYSTKNIIITVWKKKNAFTNRIQLCMPCLYDERLIQLNFPWVTRVPMYIFCE